MLAQQNDILLTIVACVGNRISAYHRIMIGRRMPLLKLHALSLSFRALWVLHTIIAVLQQRMTLNFKLLAALSFTTSVSAFPQLSTMTVPKLVVFDLDMCVWSPEMFELDSAPRSWDRSTNTGKH
jgi:Acid Phosphatase